jgi:hypothetical protein
LKEFDLNRGWQEVLKLLRPLVRSFVRKARTRFEDDQVVLVFSEKEIFYLQGAQKHLDEIQAATLCVLGANVVLKLGDEEKEGEGVKQRDKKREFYDPGSTP